VANVTGLFLTRALDRSQEFAVRAALGGGRGRILRHLVTETVSIALLGGGVGSLLSLGGLEVFRTLVPANLPRLENLSPDLRVGLFALALASMCGLACGLLSLPARNARTPDASLRESSRTGPGRGTARLRGLLVSAQVGLAAILLVGAGLLSGSLAKLKEVDPGIEVDGLMVIPLGFPASCDTDETQLAFLLDVARRIDAVPGVVSVSWSPDPPLFWRNMSTPIQTEETVDLSVEELPLIGNHAVGPGFLSTFGIPVLRGRGITWEDDATSAPVVVVDELAAERLWPEQDPLGKQLLVGGVGGREPWRTVVGVAGRVHQTTLSQGATPELYVPARQFAFFPSPMGVAVRSGIPLEQVAGAMREAVWEVDRTVPIPSITPVRERISADLQIPRLIVALGSAFSLSALVLTIAAIVGLTAYSVTSRTREVGLRLALGAQGRQVLWAVMKQCLRLAVVGLGVGLALAAGASRFLGAFLFQVSPLDPLTFGATAAGLFLAALLASLVPALRATRVEPAKALRWE